MEEAASSGDEQTLKESPNNTSKSSSVSCYQSASDCSYEWSRDASPERQTVPVQQLDMKPMDDFRDYVNLAPTLWKDPPATSSATNQKLFLYTATCSSTQSSASGLSPNSSEDSGFATSVRLWANPEARKGGSSEVVDDSFAPRCRNSIVYARSASCDSLF